MNNSVNAAMFWLKLATSIAEAVIQYQLVEIEMNDQGSTWNTYVSAITFNVANGYSNRKKSSPVHTRTLPAPPTTRNQP